MEGTLSGSITLKRLKKGVNVVLSIETENAALYQGWNDNTSTPAPNFQTPANQPILVPKAVATNGQTASITNGTWYYNNTMLVVTTTATSEGFYKCSDARFAINPSNYKLRIIDNIASASNTSNDMFTFKCSGEAASTSYESEATAELHLQIVGSSAAALYIEGGCTLSLANSSTKLKARFFIDGGEITSGYSYLFFDENNNNKTLQDSTSREFTATRDMIDGIGGIYCSAYKTGDSKKTALATDFHKITDIGDEYELEASVDKDWDGVNSQRVTAHVYRFSAGEKGDEITSSLKGTFTHTFTSSLNNIPLGSKTGVAVDVDAEIWGKITNDNEDVRDFISYKA